MQTEAPLSSRQNPTVRMLRSLGDPRERQRTGLFLLEGPHLLQEALLRGITLDLVAWSPRLLQRDGGPALLAELQSSPVRVLQFSDELMEYAVATETSQGVLAAATLPSCESADVFAAGGVTVLIDGVSDPGNVGTIVRTAAASGARGVLLAGSTADPFNPKSVRASAGAVLWLPVSRLEDVAQLSGRTVVSASSRGGVRYTDTTLDPLYRGDMVLAIGSEAHGISGPVEEAVTQTVHVPLENGVESLNAAIACGILLYHIKFRRDP